MRPATEGQPRTGMEQHVFLARGDPVVDQPAGRQLGAPDDLGVAAHHRPQPFDHADHPCGWGDHLRSVARIVCRAAHLGGKPRAAAAERIGLARAGQQQQVARRSGFGEVDRQIEPIGREAARQLLLRGGRQHPSSARRIFGKIDDENLVEQVERRGEVDVGGG